MGQSNIPTKSQAILYILIILGIAGVVNYLSTKAFKRHDMTETKEYSISPASKRMLKNLDDIINIKVYFSKNLPPHLKTLESGVKDFLAEFQAYAGKNLRVTWEDPGENEDTKSKVRSLGIPEIQLQTFEKDKAQVINGFLGIAVLFADKKEVLPLVQDLRTFEYDLAQAILKAVRTETPVIGILKTDTMPYIPPQLKMQMQMNVEDETEKKFGPLFEHLKQTYEVKTIDISEGQKIDSTIKTLIIPGGDEKSFTERDLFEIDQFFMKGGNLIVCADAVNVSFQYGVTGSAQSPLVLKLLEHYGVRVEPKMVLDASCGRVSIPQKFGMFQMNVAMDYPYFVRIGPDGFDRDNPAVSGLGEMIVPWASPLTILVDKSDSTVSASTQQNIKATVLVQSSENSWTESGYFNLNPQQNWRTIAAGKKDEFIRSSIAAYLNGNFTSYYKGKSVPPVKTPAEGDTLSQISLSAEDQDRTVVEGNTGRHLAVIGDSDFLSEQNATPANLSFVYNIVDWLTLDENLIGIRSRTLVDRTIQSDRLKDGSSYSNIIRFVNILVMPAILIIIGMVIFFKRRVQIAESTKSASAKTEAKA